jgi:hypothetical protein
MPSISKTLMAFQKPLITIEQRVFDEVEGSQSINNSLD